MLHRAATADSKMWANRFDAKCARLLDVHKTTAIGMAGHAIHFDHLARKYPGDVNRSIASVGYSVAMLAEPRDQNSLNHAAPR